MQFNLTDIMSVFKYSWVDFLFTCLGLVFLLVDIGLDVFTVVSFYQEKAYVPLGILLLLLLGSSVLVQIYSLLFYSYDNFERQTRVENCLSKRLLKLLHVFQLGIYFRLYEYLCVFHVATGCFPSVVLCSMCEKKQVVYYFFFFYMWLHTRAPP